MCHKRGRYKSDLTDKQWRLIKAMVVKKRVGLGRPVTLNMRAVVNAILYVLRTGCQWAYLPHESPNFNSVYYHYNKWCWDETWQAINTALWEQVREAAGRERQPSLAIIDSQSVKTTAVGGAHAFDGAKKVNGRKRHILVDTMGNLLSVVIHAANIGERDGAKVLLAQLPEPLWQRLEKILADGGYDGEAFAAWVEEDYGIVWEVVMRPSGSKGFVLLPVRWVVERSFAWLGRYRRLSKDFEMLVENSAGMVYLASLHRLLNRLAPVP